MAKITTSQRKKLPSSAFAGPNRSYPVNDRSHAANAKARAQQQFNKGNMPKSELSRIDRKADKVLKSTKKTSHAK